jgi:hypothetical protein
LHQILQRRNSRKKMCTASVMWKVGGFHGKTRSVLVRRKIVPSAATYAARLKLVQDVTLDLASDLDLAAPGFK